MSPEHTGHAVTIDAAPQPINIDLARTALIVVDMQKRFRRDRRNVRSRRRRHLRSKESDWADPNSPWGRSRSAATCLEAIMTPRS